MTQAGSPPPDIPHNDEFRDNLDPHRDSRQEASARLWGQEEKNEEPKGEGPLLGQSRGRAPTRHQSGASPWGPNTNLKICIIPHLELYLLKI